LKARPAIATCPLASPSPL
jgi:hypothetical protein